MYLGEVPIDKMPSLKQLCRQSYWCFCLRIVAKPGTTSGIEPGDTVEVEIEGVGILRNGVVAGE